MRSTLLEALCLAPPQLAHGSGFPLVKESFPLQSCWVITQSQEITYKPGCMPAQVTTCLHPCTHRSPQIHKWTSVGDCMLIIIYLYVSWLIYWYSMIFTSTSALWFRADSLIFEMTLPFTLILCLWNHHSLPHRMFPHLNSLHKSFYGCFWCLQLFTLSPLSTLGSCNWIMLFFSI